MENPIAVLIVALSLALVLGITFHSRRYTKTTSEFYVAGGKISWKLNGFAMLGDYASAATFLGIAGAIALTGIDGWWIGIGFFAAWIVLLLLAAGPLKNSGKFTVADAVIARFGKRSDLRIVAMLCTLVLGILYLVPQMVGAGHLFKLLLGWDYLITVIATGVLMGTAVIFGGMRGTTYNQAIQGVMLWGALMAVLVVVTIVHFGGNPFGIIRAAQEMVPPVLAVGAVEVVKGAENAAAAIASVRTLMPEAASAMTPGVALPNLANQISLVLALAFGTLGLPHILIRFYTVRDARAAQKGAELTIVGYATFIAAVFLVGLAAMYVLYPTLVQLLAEGERGTATNMALPMLSEMLGGQVFLGIVAVAAMAAMISTSTGLLISMTGSLAHDLYANILKPKSGEHEQLIFAKVGASGLTLLAIALSIWLRDQNVAILVGMCFGIAASTFAPALIATLWWKRATIQGIVAGIGVGLLASLLFTFANFAGAKVIFGIPVLINPALYSIPLALLVLIAVTYLTKTSGNAEEFLATAHRKTS